MMTGSGSNLEMSLAGPFPGRRFPVDLGLSSFCFGLDVGEKEVG